MAMALKVRARLLRCPQRSFFLFGPRGTGKSTWLRGMLPRARRFDLLGHALYLELTREPQRLEAMVGEAPAGTWVVLDEIQRVPALLHEVHRLMEDRRWRFALCGSSARKLRRGGADLLAGRALTRTLEGFSAVELERDFSLARALNEGQLPFVQAAPRAATDILAAYVNTYLKEELLAEGLIRNAPPFIRFLAVAGQLNGQTVNAMNIARDAAVGRSTVDTYFAILTETLLAHLLPAWRPGLKVREMAQPKLYWFDPGVARAAAGLLQETPDRMWQGAALETLVYHELRVRNATAAHTYPLAYYRSPAGVEIDFVIELTRRTASRRARVVLLEVKRAEKWDRTWEKSMRAVAKLPELQVEKMYGIYAGSRIYNFDRVTVLPFAEFARRLQAGKLW